MLQKTLKTWKNKKKLLKRDEKRSASVTVKSPNYPHTVLQIVNLLPVLNFTMLHCPSVLNVVTNNAKYH